MNLAETGHSTWAKSGACNLTLVDAARHDVGENIQLEKLLQGFLDGSIRPTGKGPSITKRANTEYSAQMKRAKEYGNEILQAEFNGDPYTVDEADCPIDPLGSHTPTKRGRRKGSKKSKKDATDLPTCLVQTIPTNHSNRPQTIPTQASTQTLTQTPTPPLSSLPYNSSLGHQVTYQKQPQSLPIMPLAHQWGEVNYALSSCSRMPSYSPQNIQLPFPQSRDSFPFRVRAPTVPPQANHVLRPNPAPGQVQVALLRNCHANVSGCYGCSKALKPFGRIPEPPLDIVLVTQVKREFMHDGQKREKMGNAYFHLDRKCLASKVPAFDPSLVDV